MSVADRTRSVARTGLKVQRRVALAQALFWPVVLGAGLAVAATGLAVARRRQTRRAEAATATVPDL